MCNAVYPAIILESNTGLSNGVIAGIVIGAFVGAAALTALCVFLWLRKGRGAKSAGSNQPYLGSPKFGGKVSIPSPRS